MRILPWKTSISLPIYQGKKGGLTISSCDPSQAEQQACEHAGMKPPPPSSLGSGLASASATRTINRIRPGLPVRPALKGSAPKNHLADGKKIAKNRSIPRSKAAPAGSSLPFHVGRGEVGSDDVDPGHLSGASPLAALGSLLLPELPAVPAAGSASMRLKQQAVKPPTVVSGADRVVADVAAAAKKPRVKASDLDAAAVDAKVYAKHAIGCLKDLSIPEMQCFLRSRKQPVGGKKADLEGRLLLLLVG